ncbi:hypothetical protein K8P10_001013 [Leucobacter sp. Psy1]|nr:hypothetical protein K8P10_001013 [Leucobacter sp. Psy1]
MRLARETAGGNEHSRAFRRECSREPLALWPARPDDDGHVSTAHVFSSADDSAIFFMISIINKESVVKVRASLKSLKQQPGAQVVRRRGRVYVINKQNPRFKGRQG